MSSISIPLAAWPRMLSAARTRVDAGVHGSIMTRSKVDTASPLFCCVRAMEGHEKRVGEHHGFVFPIRRTQPRTIREVGLVASCLVC